MTVLHMISHDFGNWGEKRNPPSNGLSQQPSQHLQSGSAGWSRCSKCKVQKVQVLRDGKNPGMSPGCLKPSQDRERWWLMMYDDAVMQCKPGSKEPLKEVWHSSAEELCSVRWRCHSKLWRDTTWVSISRPSWNTLPISAGSSAQISIWARPDRFNRARSDGLSSCALPICIKARNKGMYKHVCAQLQMISV